MASDDYYVLNPEHTDPARLKREREKARQLRKTQWWLSLVNRGICHYCQKKFPGHELTMDHVIPLARGGTSVQGNIVPACKDCNRDKKLATPVDDLFKQLEAEKKADAWGSEQTRFFFDLTPDRVLEAVEVSGLRCTGRCTALNSFENRVYEVELDPEFEESSSPPKNRRIVKFYRPGRWSKEQILEEHQFLL